jgi:hypothetical protein
MPEDPTSSVDIIVPPEHQLGVYANFAAVSSQSPHDITLDFIQLIPGGGVPLPVVVSRLKLSPSFLMPLMQVLSTHALAHEKLSREAEDGSAENPPNEEDKS